MNNSELQKDVQNAIAWEPLLNAAEIGVTAEDGVITLTGNVDSYFKKSEAEDAAKKVAGVHAVVEKIEVSFGDSWKKSDNDIAREVLNAFDWHIQIPKDKITITVENGWVTLDGEVQWNYQKKAARNVVKFLDGVKGVSNNISINSHMHGEIEKDEIENALMRNWTIFHEDIDINVLGHNVTLSGKVNSSYEKDEAERIAWNAPGVESVDNQLVVEFEYAYVD